MIVRLTAPAATVAGGVVTDPRPAGARWRPRPTPSPADPRRRRAAPSRQARRSCWSGCAPSGVTPPALEPSEREPAAHLAASGPVVRAGDDLAFAAEAFDQARRGPRSGWPATPDGLTPRPAARPAGISRKYAQALLEALDEQGYTRRIGDVRQLRRRGRELAGG